MPRWYLRSKNRILLVAATIGLLWSISGCGNAAGTTSSKTFSNGSLTGTYTYTLNGSTFSAQGSEPYQEIGTFVADGNGNITGGMDDFMQNLSLSSGPVAGSYSVSGDGTGMMSLNVTRGKIQLAMTLVSGSSLYLIEFDTFASGAGAVVPQNTSAISTPPSGTFVFHFHSSQPNGGALTSVSSVGLMTIQSGIISGTEDVVRAGTPGSYDISGSMTTPDSNGRGTATITDGAGVTCNYIYYVIDPNTLRFLENDRGIQGGGKVEAQNGGPFSNATLKNGFVFSSSGATLSNSFGVNSVGVFSGDGNGYIVSGNYDAVIDGSPVSDVPLGGTYQVSSLGRATITLNLRGLGPLPLIAWMVSPTQAFYLVSTPDRAEDGRLDQQQGGPFSASSLKGSFAFYMFGNDTQTPPIIDRVGVISFDGSTSLTFTNYFVNRGGATAQNGPVSGSYMVDANGRVLASSVGVVNTQVIYLTSNNAGSLILGANGDELAGSIAQQTPP